MYGREIVACFLLYTGVLAAHAQELPQTAPINGEDISTRNQIQTNPNELLFKTLFASRRGEHLEAVRGLRNMENYERQYKMIMILAEKVFLVIQTSRVILESAGFEPGNTTFPEDVNLKDALANILENTALFGDIILHLPDISHRILRAQQEWNTMIHWSLDFANRTRHLLDKSTVTMIHLVGQELNITAREPGYFNPYWEKPVDGSTNVDNTIKDKQKIARKEKRKKGPRMTKVEL